MADKKTTDTSLPDDDAEWEAYNKKAHEEYLKNKISEEEVEKYLNKFEKENRNELDKLSDSERKSLLDGKRLSLKLDTPEHPRYANKPWAMTLSEQIKRFGMPMSTNILQEEYKRDLGKADSEFDDKFQEMDRTCRVDMCDLDEDDAKALYAWRDERIERSRQFMQSKPSRAILTEAGKIYLEDAKKTLRIKRYLFRRQAMKDKWPRYDKRFDG